MERNKAVAGEQEQKQQYLTKTEAKAVPDGGGREGGRESTKAKKLAVQSAQAADACIDLSEVTTTVTPALVGGPPGRMITRQGKHQARALHPLPQKDAGRELALSKPWATEQEHLGYEIL